MYNNPEIKKPKASPVITPGIINGDTDSNDKIPEQIVEKNIRGWKDGVLDSPQMTTELMTGIIELPEWLGGEQIEAEAFDRTPAQERVILYLLGIDEVKDEALDEASKGPKNDGEGLPLDQKLMLEKPSRRMKLIMHELHPNTREIVGYEIAAVLRALEPVYELFRNSNTNNNEEVSIFLKRYESISKMLDAKLQMRHRKQDHAEALRRRNDRRSTLIDPLKGKIPIPPYFGSSTGYLDNRPESPYHRKLRRQRDLDREKKVLEKQEALFAMENPPMHLEILKCLLEGNMPNINDQRGAIAALDAIAMRYDYICPGHEIADSLLCRVRDTASWLLSFKSLVSSSDTGSGAYRAAVESRMMRGTRVRPRHTTGDPPPESPAERKMTPVVPIDNEIVD